MPDPFINLVPREQMPAEIGALWDTAMRDRDEATFFEAAANAPNVLDWYYNGFYGGLFRDGRVDRRTKELARLKLSVMHGCAFCNRGNSKAALAAGVTQEQIDALTDSDSDVFDDRDRAVLRLCEQIEMTNMDGHLDGPLYDLLRVYFDDGQIFELGVVCAVLTGMAKFLFVFDLVSREANCPIRLPSDAA